MANKVIETIMNRTSVKAFDLDRKPTIGKITQIAEAGKMAASGMNTQRSKIYVLRSKRNVEALRNISLAEQKRDRYYGASTLILVTGPKDSSFLYQDASLIMGNMMIAAASLKIGSCWINCSEELLTTKEGMKIRKRLGMSNDEVVIGTCALGYAKPGTNWPVKPRKEDFIKFDCKK